MNSSGGWASRIVVGLAVLLVTVFVGFLPSASAQADTTAPVVVINPVTGAVPGSTVAISGVSTDDVGVAFGRGYLKNNVTGEFWNGTSWATSWAWFLVPVDAATGDWSFSASIPNNGSYTAGAWAWDAANNRTAVFETFSAGLSDSADPVVVLDPVVGAVSGSPVTVSGTNTDDIGVVLSRAYLKNDVTGEFWNGSGWVSTWAWFVVPTDAAGVWSFSVLLPNDGSYSAAGWAWDAVGNRSPTQLQTFNAGPADSAVPVVVIDQIIGEVTGMTLTVSGVSTDDVGVVLGRGYLKNNATGEFWNGSSWVSSWSWFVVPVDSAGAWSFSVLLPNAGSYVAGAWAWDAANKRSATVLEPFYVSEAFILPGQTLPSDAACAAQVQPAPEIRSSNATANATAGGPAVTGQMRERVTGNFTGTTDEIIQWASCKWGVPADVARAQTAVESYWRQATLGDWTTTAAHCPPSHPFGADGSPISCPESLGLMQVKYRFNTDGFPGFEDSTAYNVDYAYSVWRDCYEGNETWLNTVTPREGTYAAGDAWGCIGRWFSGRWWSGDSYTYVEKVTEWLEDREWETSDFVNAN